MSQCKLSDKLSPWILRKEDIKNIYPLLNKDVETSGIIHFTSNKKKSMVSNKVKQDDINEGSRNSVITYLATAVYHVHPYQCYIDEKVIYGWPSGEDISQTIVWALQGNLIHLIFTVEGIYCLEINPCFIVFLRGLTNKQRGALIHWIEILGKATHGLRTLSTNNITPVKPKDWLRFVNHLTINNNKKSCGVIKCDHPTVLKGDKLVEVAIDEYMKLFSNKVSFTDISSTGEYYGTTYMSISKFTKTITSVRKSSHSFNCGKMRTSRLKWKKGQIFYSRLFPNKVPKKMIPNDYFKWLKKKEELKPLKNNVISYFPSMNGSGCSHEDVLKHRITK